MGILCTKEEFNSSQGRIKQTAPAPPLNSFEISKVNKIFSSSDEEEKIRESGDDAGGEKSDLFQQQQLWSSGNHLSCG